MWLLLNHSLFQYLEPVFSVLGFPVGLGDTPSGKGGQPGLFVMVFQVNLFRFTVINWASDAYKCYLDFSADAKLHVARHMISALDG